MTIRIEITAETPEQYQAFVNALCRGVLSEETTERVIGMSPVLAAPYGGFKSGLVQRVEDDEPVDHRPEGYRTIYDEPFPGTPAPEPETTAAAPVEPAPKKRRTKAEMEAARAAEVPAPLATQTVTRAISETPEDRTEQAEEQPTETTEQPAKVLSHDDVRAVLKVVVNAKGMPFATEQLAKIGFGKVSDVPQDKIADVIATLEQAVAA